MAGNLRRKVPSHFGHAFDLMASLKDRGDLCDVTICVEERAIPVHRIVLASCSPYFHAMFTTSQMAESHQERVHLHGVDAPSVSELIHYAYTAEIDVSEDNVQRLLPAASLFQLQEVMDVCCEFLALQLDHSNCLGIKSFCESHGCHRLVETAQKFAMNHFNAVRKTEEYLSLTADEIEQLISNENLKVSSEKEVYEAVMAWIMHDSEHREQFAHQLLQHVRLPHLPRAFLTSEVVENPIMKSTGQEFLIEALAYQLAPERRSVMTSPRAQARTSPKLSDAIFAVGGGSLFAIHGNCESFNLTTETWTTVATMNARRARLGVASTSRMLYVAGGWDGSTDLNLVEAYDPELNTWDYVHPMGVRRSCLGLSSLHGLLFAMGGFDGASCLNSVERYDPLTDLWTVARPMNVKRRYMRSAACEGVVYACGGFDGIAHLSLVEAYDPRCDSWMNLTPMNCRRSSCSVAALNGSIYVIGGNDGSLCLNSVERYDVRNQVWETCASMIIRRSTHDSIVVNGRVYVAGGNDGSSSLSSVEVLSDGDWHLATAMNVRRSSIGLAVVKC